MRRRLSVSLGKYATDFQAEIYAIFACAYAIHTNARPEKCISICSDISSGSQNNASVGATVPKDVE